MASVVRLGPGKSGGPLGITSEGIDHTILTPMMRALRFRAGDVIRLGGQQDGTIIEDKEVNANQAVIVKMPTPLLPRRYEVSLSFNPALLLHGTVSMPSMVEPTQGQDIFLQFKALKKVNLNDFDYIFELRMID